jgi:serine protease Do
MYRLLVWCVAISCAAPVWSDATPNAQAVREQARLARRSPIVQVFEASRDAVVNISSKEIVTVRDPFGGDIFQDFFDSPFRGPRERQYTRTGVGSGFVIHPDGYIVTNAHVVAQTTERKVTFADGRAFDAEVVASDATRDLAILKIEADRPLPVLHLGRSDDLMIGETVIAIGSPLNYPNTVTAGVVSAVNRDLEFSNRLVLKGLIQTDASINPGNSGGPLLNVVGELIGVNSAIRGDAQNIGFAIPVDQLREVLPDLLDIERRYRIVCGLTVDTLEQPKVKHVQAGSPAEKAGIRVGDVVRTVDGRPVNEGIDFSIALIGGKPEQAINVGLERGGAPVQVKLVLQRKPAPDGEELAREKLGFEIENLPADVAEALGLRTGSGLWITRVEADGPANQAGLARRDVLLAIGRHSVTSREDLGQLLEQIDAGDSVPITVLRVDRRVKLKLSGELQAR